MGKYDELNEYLAKCYSTSVFDQLGREHRPCVMYLHGQRIERVTVVKNLKYDVQARFASGPEIILPKLEIKLVCEVEAADAVASLLASDRKISQQSQEPIRTPSSRFHVKNKTLFPLMQERHVVFCTLLEGEVVRGLLVGFSRYELTFSMKGGVEVTVLRHAVRDLRDKKGKSYLKSAVEQAGDGVRQPAKAGQVSKHGQLRPAARMTP